MSVIKFGAWQDLSGNEVANSTDPVGDGGLVHIKTQAIGSSVSSVTIADAFSPSFDNYKILVSGGVNSQNTLLYLRLGSTDTGYYSARIITSNGSVSGVNTGNGAYFVYFGTAATTFMTADVNLISPSLQTRTYLHGPFLFGLPSASSEFGTVSGYLDNNTQYTSFTIFTAAGTMTGGNIRVYGYRN